LVGLTLFPLPMATSPWGHADKLSDTQALHPRSLEANYPMKVMRGKSEQGCGCVFVYVSPSNLNPLVNFHR